LLETGLGGQYIEQMGFNSYHGYGVNFIIPVGVLFGAFGMKQDGYIVCVCVCFVCFGCVCVFWVGVCVFWVCVCVF
jgi:hypothetical protein